MKIINLKDFYTSIYSHDCFCDVPDEVAELLVLYERREKSHRRLVYKYKAHFSLDRDDGLQNEAAQFTPSAEDAYENNIIRQALFTGLSELTDKQLSRLYAHFFLDMSYMQIACIENVDESAVP